jgi:rhomboid protease GluP
MSGESPIIDWLLRSPVTWFIMALNIGIFIIAEIHGNTTSVETLVAYGAVERQIVQLAGDYWRLLTCMFLHIGVYHLIFNTWAIVWCSDIERTVGSAWFSFAYLTTGIGASAVSVLCHDAVMAGASGAIFGMIAVYLMLLYRRAGSWEAFWSNPSIRGRVVQTAIWVVIGFAGLIPMDNFAHLGGFAFGIPAGLLLETRRGRKRPAWIAGLAAYMVVWLGVVVAACTPGVGLHWRI